MCHRVPRSDGVLAESEALAHLSPVPDPFTLIDASHAGGEPWAEKPTVVVIGNFDGVHRGHQAVLGEAVATAREKGLEAAVLTFHPHPGLVLGRGEPPVLTALPRRAELIRRLGVARVFVRKFDLEFAKWSPEEFARELVSKGLLAKVVVVGENFRFGAERAGDLTTLRELGQSMGFEARVHGVARDAGGPFSSTRARQALSRGDLEEARAVLGRPHALSGVVAEGDKRGRTIGFSTANLEGVAEVVPPDGVYAVLVDGIGADGAAHALARGVMNIGVRPTIAGEKKRTLEAHLLDFAADLYGKILRVHLIARLRDEQRFDGLDALKAQIARDVLAARALLADAKTESGAFG